MRKELLVCYGPATESHLFGGYLTQLLNVRCRTDAGTIAMLKAFIVNLPSAIYDAVLKLRARDSQRQKQA